MKKCVHCGAEINDGAKFCTSCGGTQPEQVAEQPDAGYQYQQAPDYQYQEQQAGYQYQQPGMGYGQSYQQPGMGYGQGYQQPGMGYNQGYQQPRVQGNDMQRVKNAAGNAVNNLKSVGGQFTTGVKRMGISLYAMFGIIAAVLFMVAPFMNFASMHVDMEYVGQDISSLLYGYSYDYNDYSDFSDFASSRKTEIDVSVSDGLNLFELYDLSDDIHDLADEAGVKKSQLEDAVDQVDSYLSYGIRELNSTEGLDVDDGIADEISGMLKLLVKGKAALLLTPWIFILCGAAMLVFTVIMNKKAKLISMIVGLAAFIWLIACSGHFISMMGVGALAIAIGIILGGLSVFMEK